MVWGAGAGAVGCGVFGREEWMGHDGECVWGDEWSDCVGVSGDVWVEGFGEGVTEAGVVSECSRSVSLRQK